MKEKVVIVGISSSALHAYNFIRHYDLYDIVGFAVDEQYKSKDSLLGLPIYSLEKLDRYISKEDTKLFLALLWNRLNADRKNLYNRLKEQGYKFANLISPTAIIRGQLSRGGNCWIHDYVVIQNDAKIGSNVEIMAMSLIGDHTVIGDHCFLGAKSTVAGGCTVGEQSFIGINCTVFDDTKVGKKCILGACTTVKRNVPDFTLFKTSSDLIMKQYDENEIENKLISAKNKR